MNGVGMNDTSQGPGWWQASDGKWYPPGSDPRHSVPPPPSQLPATIVPTLAERLERLAALHANGSLNNEEFEQAKRDEIAANGPLPELATKPVNRKKIIALASTVLVLGIIVTLVFVVGGSDPKKQVVTGKFTISNGNYDSSNEFAKPNYTDAGGGGCKGNSGYQDLNSIAQVVVTDDKGKEIARTELGTGSVESDTCVLKFTFEITKGPKYFVVTVGHRGSSQYTYKEITTPDSINLTIGTS